MREENEKSKEGLALWRRARAGWQPVPEEEAPDALLLAGYLDGRLSEEEAARLEARLAAEPALLDELLSLRAGLAEAQEAAPAPVAARIVERARGAYRGKPALRAAAAAQPTLLDRLFGIWLRPAVPAFAALALLVAFAGAFELGRYQGERIDATQTAEAGDSDVPVDLLMDGLL